MVKLSAVLVLTLATLAPLETSSVSSEQGRALRGGVVDEVLQDVRDLKKKGEETKVAESAEGKKGGGKKAGGGGGGGGNGGNNGNRVPGGCNGNCDMANRAPGTSTSYVISRSQQCNGTTPAILIDTKASKGTVYNNTVGLYTDDMQDSLCTSDDACDSCCCAGHYFGWLTDPLTGLAIRDATNNYVNRRVCAVANSYTNPLNVCVDPDVPIPVINGTL